MVFFTIPFWTTTIPAPSGAPPPPSGTLLTGNDSRFGPGNSIGTALAPFAQANTGHSALSGPTAGMVEKSDVSHRPNTNGLIMYASSAYGTAVPAWGYLTNLLDTGFTASYTGKWNASTDSSQYIVFQFGSRFTFTKVVWKERSFSGYPDPTLLRIKYWDGSAYQQVTTTQTTQETTDPPTGKNRIHTYTITTTPPSSEYIRMEFDSNDDFPIGEIEVYGF